MIEDEKEVVNPEETSAAPEQEQIPVNDQPAEDTAAPSTQDTEEPNQQENQPPTTQDVDWKNRYMESQRKLNEMPQVIKQTVEEVLATKKDQPQQYTRENIPQLRQYAKDNPQYADWVDNQIEDIRSRDLANTIKAEVSNMKKEQVDTRTREQSEQWVLNHPKFKDCFTIDPITKGKVWNMGNPLTALMGQVLNTVDPATGKLVKDRADGLVVAAEMAYGRYALSSENQAVVKQQQLRKDLRKSQKVTMTPMGGNAPIQAVRGGVRKALDNFNKSYAKSDLRDATRAHLVSIGLIKEE